MVSSIFEKLHPKILSGLVRLGIREPTPPQEKAIGPISRGDNILLVAPTASGKTEAALLPLFDALLKSDKQKEGVEAIYITPLRALNRDIHKRLMFWSEHLGIDIQIRHGDTSRKERRRQSVHPPKMLITTPETLQAVLPAKSMRGNLKNVRWVVVDEIHELASSKRGSQLTLGLERLEQLVDHPFQRIGLSATVGNPEEMAAFLGGTHPVEVLEIKADKKIKYFIELPEPRDEDFDLSQELKTGLKAASRLRRIIDLLERHRSTLIFVQGRGQAESLGHKLKKIEPLIEVHHGSLSREQRHIIEDRLKEGEIKGIVCTSTLQLGIDIGNVDLCIQYLSPRQVSTLVQRVGRSGHTLKTSSKGVLISAFGEDAMESIVLTGEAIRKNLGKTEIHFQPLDVLTHQIVGLTLDKESISEDETFETVLGAFPFRNLEKDEFRELIDFLESIGLVSKGGGILRSRKRGRKYYYENLGMMNDERRYPFIDLVTDRIIGTVGDEFWTLRARIGLNVILKGQVWRIIQMDEERGVIHVLPSDDPLGALPGWDGELIPVPRDVAEKVGDLRAEVAEEIVRLGSKEKAVDELSKRYHAETSAIQAIADEIVNHLEKGFPIPHKNKILLEVYDKFLVIHSAFGEKINRTFGAIFDEILSDLDLIYSWWNDPYRILIEAPRKIDRFDLEKIEKTLFQISEEDAENLLDKFMEGRFPFGYNMKFIAERFGVVPKGKTLNSKSLENLYLRFRDTPIYRETVREAHHTKLDLKSVKDIIKNIALGEINTESLVTKTPSPLAMHILETYADVEELLEYKYSTTEKLEHMKKSIDARWANLVCMNCGDWNARVKIKEICDRPSCPKCGSYSLPVLWKKQNPEEFIGLLSKWKKDRQLTEEEFKSLTHGRKTADMVLSYGRKAIIALTVHGVGPVTAYQILSRMHRNEKDFYRDLLKAKIQYFRTRHYWREG